MNEDRIECLIEGAKVVGVECRPASEEQYLRGFEYNTGNSIWKGSTVSERMSFWHLLESIMDRKDIFFSDRKRKESDYFIYFGYFVTDEPKSWFDCEVERDMIALGVPKSMSAYDTYSDLTGYLWTNYDHTGGHNVQKLLNEVPSGKYISLRFCIEPKVTE